MFAEVALLMATSLPCALRAVKIIGKPKSESRNKKVSAYQFSGRFLSPRVFSAYNTLFSKSRRFLTLITLSMPFCAFSAKRLGRESFGQDYWSWIEPVVSMKLVSTIFSIQGSIALRWIWKRYGLKVAYFTILDPRIIYWLNESWGVNIFKYLNLIGF